MWIGVLIVAAGVLLLGKTGHFLKGLLWSAAGGFIGLMVLYGAGIGVSLSLWSILTAAVLGLPGVVFLVLLPIVLL